jgi:predicted secreted hydrolase
VVSVARRAWLVAAAASLPPARASVTPRTLVFPRDHGAHPETRIEWWYVTGWLAEPGAASPAFGFQLTFFRSRTGLARESSSRFAARQLLLAHMALTDVAAGTLRHAERVARWSEDERASAAAASSADTRVHLGDWRFERGADGAYAAALADRGAGFALQLALVPTQPLLLQGDAGHSRKGPQPHEASRYYSQPQLDVQATLATNGAARAGRASGERALRETSQRPLRGRAWLDHEWSDAPLPAGAVGWDWIGINLDDGGALTAFRLRAPGGGALWAGGSFRARGGGVRGFSADEVRFEPLAWWASAATRVRYPVAWRVATPAGAFEVHAIVPAQELDARASTGNVYWEGLAECRAAGRTERIGLGYLELTGYEAPLRL